MKGVFSAITGALLLSVLSSCTDFGSIAKAEFTFVNERAADTITITPETGQDWSSFILEAAGDPADTHVVKSENGTLQFKAYLNGVDETKFYSEAPNTRTYTFPVDLNSP